MTEPTDPKREIKYYLVAYIDILGQRESLMKLKNLPETVAQRIEFNDVILDTYGFVRSFREAFFNNLKLFSEDQTSLPPQFPPEATAKLKEMKRMNVKSILISDTVILYTPIKDNDIPYPQSGIYAILSSMAIIFQSALGVEKPCRGAIELGWAISLEEGDLYGYALGKAYELESKIADYPRIVVGEELIKFLSTSHQIVQPGIDPLLDYSVSMSKVCLELISKDDDGCYILDYMGEGFKKYCFSENESTSAMVPNSYQFIEKCIETFKKNENIKLLKRYEKLKNYFDKNIHRWKR